MVISFVSTLKALRNTSHFLALVEIDLALVRVVWHTYNRHWSHRRPCSSSVFGKQRRLTNSTWWSFPPPWIGVGLFGWGNSIRFPCNNIQLIRLSITARTHMEAIWTSCPVNYSPFSGRQVSLHDNVLSLHNPQNGRQVDTLATIKLVLFLAWLHKECMISSFSPENNA